MNLFINKKWESLTALKTNCTNFFKTIPIKQYMSLLIILFRWDIANPQFFVGLDLLKKTEVSKERLEAVDLLKSLPKDVYNGFNDISIIGLVVLRKNTLESSLVLGSI